MSRVPVLRLEIKRGTGKDTQREGEKEISSHVKNLLRNHSGRNITKPRPLELVTSRN